MGSGAGDSGNGDNVYCVLRAGLVSDLVGSEDSAEKRNVDLR